jgi:hypothetical protein
MTNNNHSTGITPNNWDVWAGDRNVQRVSARIAEYDAFCDALDIEQDEYRRMMRDAARAES